MLVNEDLLKVIWFDAPESMIHRSALDLKHSHEGLPKSTEEQHITLPAKFIEPTSMFELVESAPSNQKFYKSFNI